MVRIKMLRLLCVLLLLSAGRAFAGKVDTLKHAPATANMLK